MSASAIIRPQRRRERRRPLLLCIEAIHFSEQTKQQRALAAPNLAAHGEQLVPGPDRSGADCTSPRGQRTVFARLQGGRDWIHCRRPLRHRFARHPLMPPLRGKRAAPSLASSRQEMRKHLRHSRDRTTQRRLRRRPLLPAVLVYVPPLVVWRLLLHLLLPAGGCGACQVNSTF